jgi:hypothetical protein
MASIEHVFAQLATQVGEEATRLGFAPVGDPGGAGLFGNRAARWRRGTEQLELAWDGREQWIVLSYRESPDRPPAVEWTGTLSERYLMENISDADGESLRTSLARVTAGIWSRRP